MEINAKSQRGMIWVFMIMSTIYSVAYWKLLKFFPPVAANLSPPEIAKLYSENNMEFRSGVAIMMLTAGFYIPLTVVISAQLARLEKGYPLWSKMQLIAGMLGTWLFAFPPFMWGVTAFTVERDPALTSILHEIAWLCFVTPPSYFALQVFPIAIVSMSKDNRSDSPFPRWFGYLTFWMGVTGSFGVAAMLLKTGPFAWNGWFSFYLPLFAFFLWLSCLIPLLFRAIRQQEAAQ
jgi:hypothetical protein